LRLRLRRPATIDYSDVSQLSGKLARNQAFSISFLSVLGYELNLVDQNDVTSNIEYFENNLAENVISYHE